MPDIILDVLVETVDIATVIEVDIGDLADIKPGVKDVRFRDVGHIDVSSNQYKLVPLSYTVFDWSRAGGRDYITFISVILLQVEIIGLTPELDSFVSPITSVVINMVKRDLQNLVTPLLKDLLTDVVRENAPSDLSVLFG